VQQNSMLTISRTLGRLPRRGDDSPHWFLALRGLLPILINNWADLKQGPFSPLLVRHNVQPKIPYSPDDHILKALGVLFSPSAITSTSLADLQICAKELNLLRRSFSLPYSHPTLNAQGAVHIWTGFVSQEYMELLFDRRPEALVLLAYFCVLLKKLDSCWYFKGLGGALLEGIQEELAVEWRPWIQWAIEQPVE